MQARVIIGSSAYAVITTETTAIDIQLNPGKSASQSLCQTAIEWREQAERLIRRAEIAEQAAQLLAR